MTVLSENYMRRRISDKVILLVEDNPDDVALALRAFRKNNFNNEVVVAHDGVEALEYLLSTGAHAGRGCTVMPQLVLLDINLPRVNGIEILHALRSNEKTRLIPVVILTSSTEERDLMIGYELGANSYIRKPVDFVQFTESIRQVGQYWLRLNEPPPQRPKQGQ